MRRRFLAPIVAGLLCLTLAAPAAAKGPPTITRIGPSGIPADVLAGTCDFPVEVVDTFSNSKAMEFPPQPNGDQVVRYTGGFRSTITNLDTGRSLQISYFGTGHYLFRSDGVIDIHGGGSVLVWFYPEDVLSGFDPGIYLMTGRTHFVVDAATGLALQPAEINGKVVDLCAALS